MLDHPEYYHKYHLWEYEWDKTQPWKLPGQSGVPMQRLLIAVPDEHTQDIDTVQLTVKKLVAGTNKPLPSVTFKIESADGSGDFSVTRQTGADGTLTLTKEADNLKAGQYLITEEAVPEGYVAQTAPQVVTVMPNSSTSNTFTFYNQPTTTTTTPGTGSIRKVDSDSPTVGIPGAVIRITSVKLDDGGSFFGEYTTKDGGYILKEDLDFSKLPTGAYLAEEITPPQGFILSSDVSKVKQPFVWDGEHDVSLVFENSSKVKIQLKKVDESSSPPRRCFFDPPGRPDHRHRGNPGRRHHHGVQCGGGPGEYVTDVYFDFGRVPVGFQSTINPTLTVQVLGHGGQQLPNHQPGRRGRQVPGHLADRPGHLAHHRAQAGACAHPAPDRVLTQTAGRPFGAVPPHLGQSHIQEGIWAALLIKFRSFVNAEAHVSVKSLGLRVLLIDCQLVDTIGLDAPLDQFPAQTPALFAGSNKEHFKRCPFNPHKSHRGAVSFGDDEMGDGGKRFGNVFLNAPDFSA